MSTNGLRIANEMAMDEDYYRREAGPAAAPARVRAPEAAQRAAEPQPNGDFVLAPLVDKIAFGIAKGLVEAVRELERHIAGENHKLADAVDRRLDTLQTGLLEITKFVAEQRTANAAVEARLSQLGEADARQIAQLEVARAEARETSEAISKRVDAGIETLRTEAGAGAKLVAQRIDDLLRELEIHREDISAAKTALGSTSNRIDALVERMDRQGDALRSMSATYAQRESELEQVVNGLARLRAFSPSVPTNSL
jgi:chromosome segregation ATPase